MLKVHLGLIIIGADRNLLIFVPQNGADRRHRQLQQALADFVARLTKIAGQSSKRDRFVYTSLGVVRKELVMLVSSWILPLSLFTETPN